MRSSRVMPMLRSSRFASSFPAISAAAPATRRSCVRPVPRPNSYERRERMLDLGTSFVASVARDRKALAIVDGDLRLSYAEWYRKISSVAAALDSLGLRAGDHVVTILQNRWEAATL